MNKKGLSQVVGTVVLILITVVLIAGVWGLVNSFVNNRMDSAKACQQVNTIYLDGKYTCYNQSGGFTVFSLGVNDAQIDGILISVDYGGNSQSFTLTNTTQIISNLSVYSPTTGIVSGGVRMPDIESAKTYAIQIPTIPDSIQIAAKVNKNFCGTSDSLNEIPLCA